MSTLLSSTPSSFAPRTRLAAKTEAPTLATPNSNKHLRLLQDHCVPQLVATRAASAPDASALTAGNKVMTYRELDNRANQLAHYPIEVGGGADYRDNLVRLCLDRSATAVICALAILKAGAAYLPLDPSYPSERLALMLSDAQPRVLITRQEVAEQLPAGPWQVIAIDRDDAKIACQSTDSPVSDITSEHLAYVIYTSGSTGQPKGVEITHASLMNLVSWHQSAFEVTTGDRASLLAGVGFDAAVWETWPYLTAGASLHLPDECTRPLQNSFVTGWWQKRLLLAFFLLPWLSA
jgi:non-ribosomal peptide synthetase component F